jgi:Zn-dependent protease with chaperone function
MHRENLINLNPHPLSVLLYASHPTLGQRIRALGQVGVKDSAGD